MSIGVDPYLSKLLDFIMSNLLQFLALYISKELDLVLTKLLYLKKNMWERGKLCLDMFSERERERERERGREGEWERERER